MGHCDNYVDATGTHPLCLCTTNLYKVVIVNRGGWYSGQGVESVLLDEPDEPDLDPVVQKSTITVSRHPANGRPELDRTQGNSVSPMRVTSVSTPNCLISRPAWLVLNQLGAAHAHTRTHTHTHTQGWKPV